MDYLKSFSHAPSFSATETSLLSLLSVNGSCIILPTLLIALYKFIHLIESKTSNLQKINYFPMPMPINSLLPNYFLPEVSLNLIYLNQLNFFFFCHLHIPLVSFFPLSPIDAIFYHMHSSSYHTMSCHVMLDFFYSPGQIHSSPNISFSPQQNYPQVFF